jgi:hypothetical protein
MKPITDSDVTLFKDRFMMFFFTNKQKAVQMRFNQVEKLRKTLVGFGYRMYHYVKVRKIAPHYGHILILFPWKKEALPIDTYGSFGFRISIIIRTVYEPQEHFQVGKDLWYTSPIDVKRQALAPERIESLAFAGDSYGGVSLVG